MTPGRRIAREKRTVSFMLRMHCQGRHGTKTALCPDCQSLHEYSLARLAACPFNENKPVCSKCRVHCYEPVLREKMRQVMRYSGPRMLFRHPILVIRHMIDGRKK